MILLNIFSFLVYIYSNNNTDMVIGIQWGKGERHFLRFFFYFKLARFYQILMKITYFTRKSSFKSYLK